MYFIFAEIMTCVVVSKAPLALVQNMESYFNQNSPDCSLFSQDNFEFPVHKEVLLQTRYLCEMIKNTTSDSCCCKIEILCQSISKEMLQIMVDFLYSGKISCDDQKLASQACKCLNTVFGFPIIVKEDGGSIFIKTEKQKTIQPKQVLEITNWRVGKDPESQVKNDFTVRFSTPIISSSTAKLTFAPSLLLNYGIDVKWFSSYDSGRKKKCRYCRF